ncbi:MAG: nitroreductase family protein [Nocardioides sp.]|jgi:nitroreductase|nr:nitroreductase family protein [Nocardioides sp.]
MVRRYADRPVDPEALDRLLRNATRGPSAGFSQGSEFLALSEADDVALFWTATGADPASHNEWLDGMRTAPVVIVPLADESAYRRRYTEPDKARAEDAEWAVPYWFVDTGMAALLILQTAVDEGLGACFFGIPLEHVEGFRAAFGVPPHLTPIGAVTVGHRLDDPGSPGSPARRERRADAVHRGRYST